MRPIKAVLFADNAKDYYDRIPPLPASIQVIPCTTEASAIQEIHGSQVLCCTGMFFPKNVFAAGSELRLLHSISVGMEPLLCPEVKESDVLLTNSRGANAKPVAEHAIALMMALTRNIHLSVRAQLNRSWERSSLRNGVEVEGLTLGIIGFGAIGKEISRKAHHLGMKVIATRRAVSQANSEEIPDYVTLYSMVDLYHVLQESDVVMICLPLTNETSNLIGEAELKRMKRTSYIINVSRGQIINEDALIRALREGWVGGAGLDVFGSHPLPEESPLWELPQVIITPYISASSPHTMKRAMTIFADNLLRLSSGMPLQNVVNKEIGY